MKKEYQLDFEDRCVTIGKETWTDLFTHGTNIAFDGVLAGIKQVITDGGHFMIINEDGSIHRRIDRISELNELITSVCNVRKTVADPGT